MDPLLEERYTLRFPTSPRCPAGPQHSASKLEKNMFDFILQKYGRQIGLSVTFWPHNVLSWTELTVFISGFLQEIKNNGKQLLKMDSHDFPHGKSQCPDLLF